MKKIFMLALLTFSLIQFSYADESFTVNIPTSNGNYKSIIITKIGDTYIGPGGEHFGQFPTVYQLQAIYGGGTDSAPNPPAGVPVIQDYKASMQKQIMQQQELDQQMQESMKRMDATQQRWKEEAQQKAIAEQKAREELLHPHYTPEQQKKNARDWFIANAFLWILLLFSLGVLVFILLLHMPNRLIGPDHPVRDMPLAVAVRQGMSKTQFNSQFKGLIMGEGMIVSIILAIVFKSFVVLAAAFIAFVVLIGFRTVTFIWIYLMSVFWMMVAAQFGYLLCGGHFETTGNIVSACVGGILFAIIGFYVSWCIHTAGMQYLDDISS